MYCENDMDIQNALWKEHEHSRCMSMGHRKLFCGFVQGSGRAADVLAHAYAAENASEQE